MDAASEPARTPKKKQKRQSKFTQFLVYLALRCTICFVQTLRIDTCQMLASKLAFLCYDILRIRRAVIDENLQAAFADWSDAARRQLAREMWEHILLMTCELAQVPRKIHHTNWRDYVYFTEDDIRTFVRMLLDGRPIVVVSGHFGNFEVGGVVAGLLGFPTFTVARPLDNSYLHRFVTRFREGTGQYMLPKRGSAGQIDAVLRSGGTLVLLGDQAAGPKGCWVEFFGRPASCHKAVALFSLINRAPMVLAYSKRRRSPLRFQVGLTAVFDPLTDEMPGVKELTQWYSDQLEETIRTAPSQYWWLHRRWKRKPVKKRRRRRPAAQRRKGAPAPHRQDQGPAARPRSRPA